MAQPLDYARAHRSQATDALEDMMAERDLHAAERDRLAQRMTALHGLLAEIVDGTMTDPEVVLRIRADPEFMRWYEARTR
jgi:hypothetical protein